METIWNIFFISVQIFVVVCVVVSIFRLDFSDEVAVNRFICLAVAIILFQVMGMAGNIREIANFLLQR